MYANPKFAVVELVDVRARDLRLDGVVVEDIFFVDSDHLAELSDGTIRNLKEGFWYNIAGSDHSIIENCLFPHNPPAEDENGKVQSLDDLLNTVKRTKTAVPA